MITPYEDLSSFEKMERLFRYAFIRESFLKCIAPEALLDNITVVPGKQYSDGTDIIPLDYFQINTPNVCVLFFLNTDVRLQQLVGDRLPFIKQRQLIAVAPAPLSQELLNCEIRTLRKIAWRVAMLHEGVTLRNQFLIAMEAVLDDLKTELKNNH